MQLPSCPGFRTELPNGQIPIGSVIYFYDSKDGKRSGDESCRIEPTTTPYVDKQREEAQNEKDRRKPRRRGRESTKKAAKLHKKE
jgi:hypothetical protein